eukprot:16657-Heterococcus_DN1.PRE.1
MPVEATQWTKLRIAFVGQELDYFLDLTASTGEVQCDVALISKDGVFLQQLPRKLASRRMFFTPSSRVDVVVRCPIPGVEHVFSMVDVTSNLAYVGTSDVINIGVHVASLIVTDSSRPAAPDLKSWSPCRPQYLRGLQQLDLPEDDGLELNITPDGINGQAWSGLDNPLFTVEHICMRMRGFSIQHTSYCICFDDQRAPHAANSVHEVLISGSGRNPIHFHMNHVQIIEVPIANFDGLPAIWHQPGDWVDTISFRGNVTVRIPTNRFSGAMMVNSQISTKSDAGTLGV